MDYNAIEKEIGHYPISYIDIRKRLKDYLLLRGNEIKDEEFLAVNDFYDYLWAQEIKKYLSDNNLDIQGYINYINDINKL